MLLCFPWEACPERTSSFGKTREERARLRERRVEFERHQIQIFERVIWGSGVSPHLLAPTSCTLHLHSGVLVRCRPWVFSPQGVSHVNLCVFTCLDILFVICADCSSSCLLLEPYLRLLLYGHVGMRGIYMCYFDMLVIWWWDWWCSDLIVVHIVLLYCWTSCGCLVWNLILFSSCIQGETWLCLVHAYNVFGEKLVTT
jgi:hypothetical protein